MEREGVEGISNEEIEQVLSAERSQKITKDILVDVLRKMKRENKSVEEATRELAGSRVGEKEIRETISRIIQKNEKLVKEKGLNAISALMGDAMKELRGKADGQTISRILREEIGRKK